MFQLPSDRQVRQQLQHIMTRAAYGPCVCLHPDTAKLDCDDNIKSHAIQKKFLRLISDKRNKVYTQHTSLSSSSDIVRIKKVGINEASTFRGFCSLHDNELFRSIEDYPLQLTEEHVALHSFRGECRQLYFFFRLLAFYQNHILPHEGDRSSMYRLLGLLFHLQTGTHCWLLGGGRTGGMIDVIRGRRYNDTSFVALIIDSVPDIMTCTSIVPTVDVRGNGLQDPFGSKPLHTIGISLLPYGERNGVLLFSWYKKSSINERFMHSLLSLDAEAIPDTIVRFLFHHVKDIYFSPRWWDRQKSDAKDNLSQRFLHTYRGRPACYVDSEDDGYQYVHWNITDFDTNLMTRD